MSDGVLWWALAVILLGCLAVILLGCLGAILDVAGRESEQERERGIDA